MGKSERTKGAAAEREVFKIIREATGIELKRNLEQYQDTGSDAHIHGFCIEIKRQEALKLKSWWKQVCEEAVNHQEIPVLIYRQSNQPWRVVLPWYSTSYMGLIANNRGDDVPAWVGDYEYTQTVFLDPVFTMLLAEAEALVELEESKGGTIKLNH